MPPQPDDAALRVLPFMLTALRDVNVHSYEQLHGGLELRFGLRGHVSLNVRFTTAQTPGLIRYLFQPHASNPLAAHGFLGPGFDVLDFRTKDAVLEHFVTSGDPDVMSELGRIRDQVVAAGMKVHEETLEKARQAFRANVRNLVFSTVRGHGLGPDECVRMAMDELLALTVEAVMLA